MEAMGPSVVPGTGSVFLWGGMHWPLCEPGACAPGALGILVPEHV